MHNWFISLSGPLSWPVVFGFALLVSGGPDGGWEAMAFMFKGLGVIVLIHVIAPVFLIVTAGRRLYAHKPIGKIVVFGLCYYLIVAIIALLLEGPNELIKDSRVALDALFRQ